MHQRKDYALWVESQSIAGNRICTTTLISAKNVIINLPTWITVARGRRKDHMKKEKLLNIVDDEYKTKRWITDAKRIYANVCCQTVLVQNFLLYTYKSTPTKKVIKKYIRR